MLSKYLLGRQYEIQPAVNTNCKILFAHLGFLEKLLLFLKKYRNTEHSSCISVKLCNSSLVDN